VCQVGDSHALLIVMKEAMAPCTTGRLASGMARGGHIHHENYGFIGADGLASMPAISHSLDLHVGNMRSVAHGGHTPETAHGGCILEFIYLKGQEPLLVTGCGQVFHP
jgi:hypothetical protein